jgi:pimeloyl-ACP methyl ester carboxylesterase
MSRQRRHTAKHLFWRGVVATVGNAAMFTGVYPVALNAGLAYERNRAGKLQPRGQLRSIAREWKWAAAMSAARPLGFLGVPGATERVRGPRPIIVVHGYWMNRVNFAPLAVRLRRAGLGPVYGFEYWTLGKVSSAAERLAAYVDEVRASTGADRVDVIGHSMGGVVGRYYITLGGGAPFVRCLITLGSPHGGADFSRFGVGRPVKDLRAGSPLLSRLSATGLPTETAVTAVWSRSDALVPWEANARLPGAEMVAFEDLGHLSLIASRRVADVVIERLRR